MSKSQDAMPGSQQQVVSCIVAALKADARRDIYEARYPRDEFWISYQGGGPFAGSVVKAMATNGLLVRKYPDCECYTLAANDKLSHGHPTTQKDTI